MERTAPRKPEAAHFLRIIHWAVVLSVRRDLFRDGPERPLAGPSSMGFEPILDSFPFESDLTVRVRRVQLQCFYAVQSAQKIIRTARCRRPRTKPTLTTQKTALTARKCHSHRTKIVSPTRGGGLLIVGRLSREYGMVGKVPN